MWTFQTEIAEKLESLKKKLRMLNKTKEHWEETKNYIQVKVNTSVVSIIFNMTSALLYHYSNPVFVNVIGYTKGSIYNSVTS